jgi:pyrroline-5-carboxylate reductase
MTTYRMYTTIGMSNIKYQFGFIGMGNMGTAMLKGCLCVYNPAEIIAVRKNEALCREEAARYGYHCAGGIRECAENARFIILAVKPQVYPEVLPQVREALTAEHVVLSLAPNYTIGMLKEALGENARIVRVMPNTPAAVGAGMTGYTYSDDAFSEEEKEQISRFLTSFGLAEEVPERLMSAVTAASGSSPAFIYMMIEALADGVVACGMPRKQAYRFVAQTVLGSAKMALETGKHPGQLKDEVCSPGGTTIAGVARLEEAGFRSSLIEAALAVDARCKKM